MSNVEVLRQELSIAWRFLGAHGYTDTIFNHISASAGGELFLVNSWCRLAVDCLPEDFVLCTKNGPVDLELTGIVNPTAINLHGGLHTESKCAVAIHLHSPYAMSIAATDLEIQPINQISMEFFGDVAYIPYRSVIESGNEATRIKNEMLSNNCAILRNHGLLVCGESVAEAVYLAYYLEIACRLQLVNARAKELLVVDDTIAKKVGEEMRAQRAQVLPFFWNAMICRNLSPQSQG